jgi:hypothetical protein
MKQSTLYLGPWFKVVSQASPSDSQRWMYCITTTRREGLHNFLALQLYVQDQSDCMTSKSIQQTRELGGTSGLREFDGSAKDVLTV